MPITKSFKKSVKTSEKSHLRNMSIKSKVKSSIKKFEAVLTEKKSDEIGKMFVETISVLDNSASKGVISKNTVSRNKARLAKKVNELGIAIPKKEAVAKKVTKKTEKKAMPKIKEEPVKEVKVKTKKDEVKPEVKPKEVKEVKKEVKPKAEKAEKETK